MGSAALGVAPDAAVPWAEAPFRADGGCLDHDHPRTTYGTTAEMDKMPGGLVVSSPGVASQVNCASTAFATASDEAGSGR